MIHICTVHYKITFWEFPQSKNLQASLPRDGFLVYSSSPSIFSRITNYQCKTDYEPIAIYGGNCNHGEKLDYLFSVVSVFDGGSNDDDILVFLDGDAWPMKPLFDEYLKEKLAEYPLIAIRRDEMNETHPHPAFTATTVGFWKENGFNWRCNDKGVDPKDPGGVLGDMLAEKGIKWYPMLKSNVTDHPVWNSVYDGVIFHAGGGFREKISRVD